MDWQTIFNFGVPTAILLMVMLAIWKIILWSKTSIVEPVVASHLTLINSLNTHLPKQTAGTEKLVEEMEKQTDLIIRNAQGDLLKATVELQEKQNKTLEEISQNTGATSDRVSKWPSDLVNKVTESVMEKIRKLWEEKYGCHLSDTDIAAVLKVRKEMMERKDSAG